MKKLWKNQGKSDETLNKPKQLKNNWNTLKKPRNNWKNTEKYQKHPEKTNKTRKHPKKTSETSATFETFRKHFGTAPKRPEKPQNKAKNQKPP